MYSFAADSPLHRDARRLVRQLAEGPADWAIPWPCVHEFVSIVTSPRIYRSPANVRSALAAVENWAQSPGLTFLSEAPGYLRWLESVTEGTEVTGGLIHDAKIAAICLQHGVSELITADRDFSRFARLRTRNPFVA